MGWEERENQGTEGARRQVRENQAPLPSLHWNIWDIPTMGSRVSSPLSLSSMEGELWKTVPC